MDKIEKQKFHFEKIAKKYYESRQTPNHLYVKELMWDFFFLGKDYLKNHNVSVLEPMCGYSEGKKIIERFLLCNVKYEGFDYCETLVDTVKQIDPSIDIYRMDVTSYKASKLFDIIIMIGALHHVPDNAKDIIQKMHHSLKDGGYFINFEPTNNSSLIRKIRENIYKKNSIFDYETERAFEYKEISSFFEEAGFKKVDQIFPGLLTYVLYYNPDAFPRLNIGGKKLVKFLFDFDKLFFRNFIGKKMSFTTLSLYQKQ